jgi:dipeptide/tripeptide permease
VGNEDVAKHAAETTVPTSHPTGFKFFFWGEFAERSSYYGMRAILALYMTERLGVDKADAGTFMSLFIAACYFFPLVGGFLADNFFGKYWTIVGFSIPYVVAQFLVGIENRYVVFGALALLAMGSGVIKPNISTLMGLTYDQQRPGQTQLRTSAFSWFYMSINIGALLSQIAMPWLRTAYGYQVAFLFPAGLMTMALIMFAIGKRYYAVEVIERKIVGTGEAPPEGKTITGLTKRYKYVTREEKSADRALKFKTLLRIGSVFLMVMFFWAIFDQSASTWIFFADTYMNCTLFGVPTSADAIQASNALFVIIFVPISVWLFKTLNKMGWKVAATHKMMLGFVLTGVAMLIMSGAGFLAGQKQDALKLTTPEGSLILSMPAGLKLEEVKTEIGKPTVVGDTVNVSMTDGSYDKDKKKMTFATGTIKFATGADLVVAAGHLPTKDLPNSDDLLKRGVLEPLLKPADELNKVTSEPAKASLEVVDWVKPAERVTVWWQVLAFLVITWAEILISVTGLELAFVAAPQSMKSFVTACWLFVVFLANFLINAPITRLYPYTTPGVYFAGLAGAMAVVTVLFIPVSIIFNRGMARAEAEAQSREANTEAV